MVPPFVFHAAMRTLTCLLSFALSFATVAAQSSPQVGADARAASVQETDHLTIKTSTKNTAAAPGGRLSLWLDIAPKEKMHVYAPGQKTYIPVSITLTPDAAIKARPPIFPPAEKYFFKPLNETQQVYSKPFRVVQEVTLASALDLFKGSTLTIAGTVRYQACDDAVCYLPKSVPVVWTVPLNVSATRK